MADDEDAIYIDVVPRVDDSAADSAVEKLKDKFKDATKDVGPEFLDALGNSGALETLGTKLGEALSGPLKDLSDGVGLDLKNPLEKMLKQDMGGALDDVMDQLGTKLGSVIKEPLKGMADTLGVDVESAISKALNKDWGGLGAELGKGLGGKIASGLGLDELLGHDGLDGVITKVHSVADAIKAFRGGDISGGIGGAAGLLGDLGLPGAGTMQDFLNNHDQIKGVIDAAKELVEGTGLAALLGAPEVGLFAATLAGGGVLGKVAWDHLAGPVPNTDTSPEALSRAGVNAYRTAPMRPGPLIPVEGQPAPQYMGSVPSFAPLDMPPDPQNPLNYSAAEKAAPKFDPSLLPHSGGGSATVEAQQATVEAGSATVVASSVSLGGVSLSSLGAGSMPLTGSAGGHGAAGAPGAGAHPTVTTPHGVLPVNPLDILAPMDKGKHGFAQGGVTPGGTDIAPWDTNHEQDTGPFVPFPTPLPPKGTRTGGANFNPNIRIDTSTTTSTGTPRAWSENEPTVDDDGNVHWPKGKPSDFAGVLPGSSPGYDNMIGMLSGGGMVGLEGGEGVVKPSAMAAPGVAALITQLNQHYDEGTSSPAGVGGDSNNPTLSTTPTQSNTAGGNTPKQPQQLGSGQGAGISGGGLIGAAEQAGVAAAGVAGFGGGAIAAQIAVQETNLAVQKASQNVAALATAPFETFGLQGGQMGAPQVNPMGGWIGKLIGGALGQMNNLPNIAGASVQPPKQPQQKQPGDDQQGQGETPTGPSGAKDDPMHVNVTNQPSPQQGSATSAMNAVPGLTMSVP